MPGKSCNAPPNSVHHTFDSHSILSQFEPPHDPDVFTDDTGPDEGQEREAILQHGTIASPQVPVNELGIYEAPTYIESSLSPLEAFNETAEPHVAPVPEEPLYQELPGHIRSPILSK
jgi:hypothetical protein